MRITVREKLLEKGRVSLYLDYYPPIIINGKLSRRETLQLYTVAKPKTEIEKAVDKKIRKLADLRCAERQIQLNENPNALAFLAKQKGDFVSFFGSIVDEHIKTGQGAKNWLNAFKLFKLFCRGKCRFTDITEDYVNKYRAFLLTAPAYQTRAAENYKVTVEKTISPNSARNYLQTFKSVVNKAFRRRLIQEDPFIDLSPIKSKAALKEFLTLPELRLLNETMVDKMPDVVRRAGLFSALTGLRYSDIKRLTWMKVRDGDEPFLVLRIKKNGEPLTHPISPEAREILGERRDKNLPVFQGLRDTSNVNIWVRRWVIKAGIHRDFTFHCFRHTYASIQQEEGTPVHEIRELLGHSKLTTTINYLHGFGTGKRKAANLIKLKDS